MIFGFNTDVKHGDTVYHVQSEAREAELLLQTQVFVRGRCIGKRATSYAPAEGAEPITDQQKESILRDQHRLVLDAIRDGRVEEVLVSRDAPATKELDVQWLNAASVHGNGSMVMRLRVTEGGLGVEGARLTVRFARPEGTPFYAQVLTDPGGNADMSVQIDDYMTADASILVQASYGGRTAMRKFQLRRVDA